MNAVAVIEWASLVALTAGWLVWTFVRLARPWSRSAQDARTAAATHPPRESDRQT